MKEFAELLDRLTYEPARLRKLRLLTDYLRATPDPDRGYAVAAITRDLDIPHAKPALLRGLVETRVDPVLFALSYDYVGDLAETISLVWPDAAKAVPPRLGAIVPELRKTSKTAMAARLAGLLDALDPPGRYALIKLLGGGLRVGVSARLAKTALAELGGVPVPDIEELWHGLDPPYEDLFAWLDGNGPKPQPAQSGRFRPMMLAHALEEADLAALDPGDFLAEWKWDGIRIQAVREGETRRLYSRTGDDISTAFPDVVEGLSFEGAIDGELLVVREGAVAPFNDLQKRLGRKTVSERMMRDYPAKIFAYDALALGGEDLRTLPFETRRKHLEARFGDETGAGISLSPLVPFEDWENLAERRRGNTATGIEGLMLKHRRSPYLAGRVKGHWFKWKRDPHLVDAVLLYAQRGHGKRSSFYSDYTFGVWRGGPEAEELVPVGKAYFGFTDEELKEIDRFVRQNTVNRFGPVREVAHGPAHGLVLEVAFEGLMRSSRHKSGLAMRFPRIHRLRWDKPPAEADRIETLEALLPPET